MDSKLWTWYQFRDDVASPAFQAAINQVSTMAQRPVLLEISALFATDPEDFDPHPILDESSTGGECRTANDGGRLWFEFQSNGDLKLIEERCRKPVIDSLANCKNSSELRSCLVTEPQEMDWVWLDVYIGVLITLNSKDKDAQI